MNHTGGEGGPAGSGVGDEGYGGWERPPAEPGSGLTGALPLRRDGMIVGAVGVSGAPAPLDEAIARAAAAAF
ncbi:heme-binding protein [Frankia sp. ArI3]|uniref:heme-binding protein n=1 Tax=Frankia sp. ArI3 TaxID=1858 RepID=UPI0021063DB6|nr:heme-binding protein [Frankia sp. ArI3]